jgi:hypothetical protein
MCNACWVDRGCPSELPPTAAELVTLIQQLYAQPDGGSGGPLHVFLDDFNVDHIEPFREFEWEPQTWRLAELIAAHMRPLSPDQRAAVLALWEGWLELPAHDDEHRLSPATLDD